MKSAFLRAAPTPRPFLFSAVPKGWGGARVSVFGCRRTPLARECLDVFRISKIILILPLTLSTDIHQCTRRPRRGVCIRVCTVAVRRCPLVSKKQHQNCVRKEDGGLRCRSCGSATALPNHSALGFLLARLFTWFNDSVGCARSTMQW